MNQAIKLSFKSEEFPIQFTIALVKIFESSINWASLRVGRPPMLSEFAEAYCDALNLAGCEATPEEVYTEIAINPEYSELVATQANSIIQALQVPSKEVAEKTKKRAVPPKKKPVKRKARSRTATKS